MNKLSSIQLTILHWLELAWEMHHKYCKYMDKLFILGQLRVIARHDIWALWLCLFQHYEECLSLVRDPLVPAMILMPMKLLLYQL